MRCGSLFAVLVVLAGCPGGDGSVGDRCSDRGDCSSSLQCVASACVPLCLRATDCGDGYSCDKNGICHAASGQLGDSCTSQVDCAAGLACELEGSATDATNHLLAACAAENPGSPAGSVCAADTDCRNGTCALGHCVDLCSNTLDCVEGTSCALIPRVEAGGKNFAGCLQSHGVLRWTLPVHGPSDTVPLPIPDSARSVAVTFSVEDAAQMVGATSITPPNAVGPAYTWDPTNPEAYYENNNIRHKLEFAQSVLALPSTPDFPLQSGMYTLKVESQRLGGVPGTATPSATAAIKLDTSVILDLHFYFLNFDEHPCADSFNGKLDATAASTASFFQSDFLVMLRSVLAIDGGVALGTLTYEDLRDHPDLDGLDVANAPALLALGSHDVGVNVFFVRTLSPVGLQAFAPSPGPAGLAGTRGSGVVIGLDTLCYRSWQDVARLTAHEIARYMGLYDIVEADDPVHHLDPISDDNGPGSDANLMFYSELGGTTLSDGQRDILSRSPVLR
jgi:hypothetical protein